MKRLTKLKKFLLSAGVLLLLLGLNSCSNDGDEKAIPPTGNIQVDDILILSENTITVNSITVGQASWLTAVEVGEETTNNFIAPPVMIESGTNSDVQLTFNESAIPPDEHGHPVVLKLYADNLNRGTKGEWDHFDVPIKGDDNDLVIKRATLYPDYDNTNWFDYYDSNEDGKLDVNEILRTYRSAFDFYETEFLTLDEFYSLMFFSTNINNYDQGITEDEWDEGYLRMFGNWAEDVYSDFDQDGNDFLNQEEWLEIFKETNWFGTYDTDSDNLLTEAEMNIGFFNDWDLNFDGIIDEEEFNHYRPFVAGLAFREPMM